MSISDEVSSVEAALAENLPFQSVVSSAENLKLADRRLDLAGLLRKPYHRRQISLFDSITDMIVRRRGFVHRTVLQLDLNEALTWRFVDGLETSIDRLYTQVIQINGWIYDKGWATTKVCSSNIRSPPERGGRSRGALPGLPTSPPT
jgi:hypothetical protein